VLIIRRFRGDCTNGWSLLYRICISGGGNLSLDKSETLFLGERFRVEAAVQLTPNGPRRREVVRHPGAVTILPLLSDGQICLIRNLRVAVDETLIELPAGTREQDEPQLETARRELIEETGYRAGQIEKLTDFYLSPGILDERMHLYLATELSAGDADREVGEEIANLVVSFDAALDMIGDGRIRDAKTIVGLLYYQRYCRNR